MQTLSVAVLNLLMGRAPCGLGCNQWAGFQGLMLASSLWARPVQLAVRRGFFTLDHGMLFLGLFLVYPPGPAAPGGTCRVPG